MIDGDYSRRTTPRYCTVIPQYRSNVVTFGWKFIVNRPVEQKPVVLANGLASDCVHSA